ncbi:hypothetical protein Tco_0536728 [Tanacetum coccineum]
MGGSYYSFPCSILPSGRTAKLRNDILMFQQHQGESLSEAWTCFKDLLQKVPHHGIDLWLQDAISLMGRREGVLMMTSNEIYQLPPEPSRQEEFEHIVMNFILDREERVKQLEEYMKVIVDDFMKLSSEVIRRLKEKIREEGSRKRKIEKISKYPDVEAPGPLAGHKFLENHVKKGDIIDWEFLAHQNLDQTFFDFISTDPFSRPQWGNFFRVNEPIYGELVREFFASFEFEASACRLYTERKSRDNATLSGLSRAETVKENRLLMEFWPSIRDSGFNVGNTKVASIRDPRVKLAYRCIATTIAGRKETIHRVTEIDLYYLYCIYTPKVVCNIPYWLSKYLKAIRDKNLIYGGMFVTRIARSFGLLTNEMRDALSIEPPPHEKGEEEAEGEAANERAGGFAEMYKNMSQGDWQVHQARWMDQQDERWEQLDAWRG